MRILFVHLLNNYTGSPRVLANFLSEFSQDENNDIYLLTSKTDGCLSNISNIKYCWNHYKWINNKKILSILLLFTQIYQFFYVLFSKEYDCVYINTILPFGAAIAAKIRKEKIIYHIHEYYPKMNLMQKICIKNVDSCADRIIYVSEYLKDCYENIFKGKENYVIHNTNSREFIKRSQKYIYLPNYIENKFNNRIIVLPCSLKKYKGVSLFLELAKKMTDYNFQLVISNTKDESDYYFRNERLPQNFSIINEEKKMEDVYNKAGLVLNLSIPHGPDKFIETFAMVIIEAFAFKTPCIAPCYGGPLEIIQENENGYLLEIENLDLLCERIHFVFSSYDNYIKMCNSAINRINFFNIDNFIEVIKSIIKENL